MHPLKTSLLVLLSLTAANAASPVFESARLTSTSLPRLVNVDVPLKDAKELYLVVSDEGDMNCDWADWIEPKLVMAA